MKHSLFLITLVISMTLASFTTIQNDEIKLVNYENAAIGFTILVPEKANVLADSEYGFTTSKILSDQVNEINVTVNRAVGNISTLEDFKADLKKRMVKNIISAEKTANGFYAINKEGKLRTVYHRVGSVQAKISVPVKYLELAEKIAKSVQPAK